MTKSELNTLDEVKCRELTQKIIQAKKNNSDTITFSGFRFKRKRTVVIANSGSPKSE